MAIQRFTASRYDPGSADGCCVGRDNRLLSGRRTVELYLAEALGPIV